MKRADQLQHRPARRSVSTRDRRWLTRGSPAVNRPSEPALSDVLEMAIMTRRIVSVAVELTMILPRSVLEEFVERLIARLDDAQGDADLEDGLDPDLEDVDE